MDRRWLIPLVLAVTIPSAYVVQYGWTLPSFQLKPTPTAPALPEPTQFKLTRDIVYRTIDGVHPIMTSLDVYSPLQPKNGPVVVMVHSGRWGGDKSSFMLTQQVPLWLTRQGVVLVAINYRQPPDGVFPGAVEDLAAAVGWVRQNIAAHGGDPNRIVLGGLGMGAHFVALNAVDPQYLAAFGVPADTIDGAFGVNGTSYDVRAALSEPNDRRREWMVSYFGHDPERHDLASPVKRLSTGHPVPPLLLIYTADRPNVAEQATLLADAVRGVGGTADLFLAQNESFRSIYMNLGQEYDATTEAIEDFLYKVWPGLEAENAEAIPPYDPLPGETVPPADAAPKNN